MNATSFQQFRADALASGFDEVLVREWKPGTIVPDHTHEFDISVIVMEGELWLTAGGAERRLGPGDTFELGAGTAHAERYGPQGAVFWVARKHH
jgi:quercetin dioxygenase-like cupin family protein